MITRSARAARDARDTADELDPSSYPDSWQQDELPLTLTYQFEPGQADDGVTVRVPLAALHQLSAAEFSWQVPGLREELVTALIRSLPKQLRRNFVPAPDVARAVLDRIKPGDESGRSLPDALSHELHRLRGVTVPRDAWDLNRLPAHLRITFQVVDDHDKTVTEGKDLDALKRELTERVRAELDSNAADIARSGLRDWDLGELPRSQRRTVNGVPVTAYPTLVDEGDSVAVRLVGTEAEPGALAVPSQEVAHLGCRAFDGADDFTGRELLLHRDDALVGLHALDLDLHHRQPRHRRHRRSRFLLRIAHGHD